MSTLGQRIKSERLLRNMTQTELGNVCGVTKYTISLYENDKSTPSDEIKSIMANFFGVSVDYLLGRTDIKNIYENTSVDLPDVPKEYSNKYKVTSRDKKQYAEEMKKANEAFFMDDELDEDAKKEMLDLMSELFWQAKAMNKRKK